MSVHSERRRAPDTVSVPGAFLRKDAPLEGEPDFLLFLHIKNSTYISTHSRRWFHGYFKFRNGAGDNPV